jgi:capsular polysaccharide export protein
VRVEDLPAIVYVSGLSGRKMNILRQFARFSRIEHAVSCTHLPAGSTLILWGRAALPEDCPDGISIVRVEDGFLRSVGLGADLVKPVSWVFDRNGIYFDSTCPSDLEILLATSDFTPEMTGRAHRLLQRIVACNLTKYNVGTGSWTRPAGAMSVILVPGQVESDASIRFGAPGVSTNMGLLQAVRESNPAAHVVYKPHPDVLSGLRAQGQDEGQALEWCDEQVTDVSMGELLPQVDELHTMTSLAGFEALLRGKRVTCFGQPFYAGWGLTTDLLTIARRTRRLTLDELVCGTLLLYPTYVSRTGSGSCITPEQALDELLEWIDQSGVEVHWWRKLFRILLRRVVGVK